MSPVSLEEIGIPDAARRLAQYPHQLSGGLQQRMMIAAALVIEPRLLLADEPTTSLDVTTQAEVMAILDEQRRQKGLGMIFVTHDLDLAAAVCDRIAVMYAGFVVEDRCGHQSPRRGSSSLHGGAAGFAAESHREGASGSAWCLGGRSRPSRSARAVRLLRAAPTWRSAVASSGRSCVSSTEVGCAVTGPTSSADSCRAATTEGHMT